VVAVCGSNESLYQHVSAIKDDRLRVLGFTDRISDYMDAADLIITKPGGLSSTEAANKALPMVFVNFVGGCESRNFNFFLEKGYAVGSAAVKEAAQIAADLAADGVRRQAMSQALAENFTVNSGLFIADFLMDAAEKYRNKQKEAAGVL
jgi:processive 1,2-diacylglycerol beta-glucosyltransferase